MLTIVSSRVDKGMVESNGRVLGEKVCWVNYRFGSSTVIQGMAHMVEGPRRKARADLGHSASPSLGHYATLSFIARGRGPSSPVSSQLAKLRDECIYRICFSCLLPDAC